MSVKRTLTLSLLTYTLPCLAGIVLFFLMILTCADVVGRYFFNSPLPGAFEATGIGVALVIYAALPFVTARDEHVTVNLFDSYIPPWWRMLQAVVIRVISLAVLCLVAWALWRTADGLAVAKVRTDAFRLPIAPVPYFMSVMTGITALVLAIMLVAQLFSRRAARASGSTKEPRE